MSAQPCSICPLHSEVWAEGVASVWHVLFSWQREQRNGGAVQWFSELLLEKHASLLLSLVANLSHRVEADVDRAREAPQGGPQ